MLETPADPWPTQTMRAFRMVDPTLPQERCDFYVYVIFRPTGEPCYVGKGSGGRWRKKPKFRNNRHLARISAAAGGDLPTVVIRDGLTEQEAFAAEIAFIAAIGREANGGPLVNSTDGGEGLSGYKFSPDVIAKIAERNRGKTRRPETGAAISASKLGRPRLDLRGKPLGDGHKAKLSAANIGKHSGKLSLETRLRMSASKIGKKTGPSSAISAALTGVKRTESAKSAMREGWARRRQRIAIERGQLLLLEYSDEAATRHIGYPVSDACVA